MDKVNFQWVHSYVTFFVAKEIFLIEIYIKYYCSFKILLSLNENVFVINKNLEISEQVIKL